MVTIISSGETHAMLLPCDCAVDPGGGLAERSTILKAFPAAERLLLDAGGFAAGGIYDNYTQGRQADSQRTIATLQAMGLMGYDAVAIGDDDLQYGGGWLAKVAQAEKVPLVSANCRLSGNRSFVPPYRIVVKNGIRFAITALTPSERLFPTDDSCVCEPPLIALRRIWDDMVTKSDYQIVLSHLGEEMTDTIIDAMPKTAVIVNGHRKTSHYPALTKKRTLVMQFGYQGKKLSIATLKLPRGGRNPTLIKSSWIKIGTGTEPDTTLVKLLKQPGRPEPRQVYDLYIMSHCPYGISALREFTAFVAKFPAVEWNIWFIGTQRGDSSISLHGNEEVADEIMWLAVKALYPGQWLAFLSARSKEGARTDSCTAQLGLDGNRILTWINQYGNQELAHHYRRSMRLGTTSSPSLFVNNAALEIAVECRRLEKIQCGSLLKKPALCDSVPECFEDRDCRKKGMVGHCTGNGSCEFIADTAFTFTVLIADSTVQHPEKSVIATTEELFPGANVEVVLLNSHKGDLLAKKYAPSSLPFYLFGAPIALAHHFSQVESGLTKVDGGFIFKAAIAEKNYFPGRIKKVAPAILFIDPLFAEAGKAMASIRADSLRPYQVRVLPILYADPTKEAPSMEEKIRREEAQRWLVMDSLYPDKFSSYLALYAKDPGSSLWFVHLPKCGIARDVLVRQVQSQRGLLWPHWQLLSELGVKEPVTLLLNNRQLVVIRNDADLTDALETIKLIGEK